MGRHALTIATESRHGPELILRYSTLHGQIAWFRLIPGLRFFVRCKAAIHSLDRLFNRISMTEVKKRWESNMADSMTTRSVTVGLPRLTSSKRAIGVSSGTPEKKWSDQN